jgi:hypothetical protein
MLLVGAIEACALYQGVRAAFSFRTARTREQLDGANLRALSAIAFGALGAGEGLRYVGIALFAVLALAYAGIRLRRAAGPAPEPEIAAGA